MCLNKEFFSQPLYEYIPEDDTPRVDCEIRIIDYLVKHFDLCVTYYTNYIKYGKYSPNCDGDGDSQTAL